MHRFHSSGPLVKNDFDVMDMALNLLERALWKYTTDGFAPATMLIYKKLWSQVGHTWRDALKYI